MLLMEEAERIAREEHGSVKLAVISGVFLIYFSPHRVSLLNMISNRSRNPRLLQKVGIRVGWALHEQVADLANVCSHWIYTASRGYLLYITWTVDYCCTTVKVGYMFAIISSELQWPIEGFQPCFLNIGCGRTMSLSCWPT